MDNKHITRVNSFLNQEDYTKLKIKLTIQGKSFTKWLKEKVKEEIAGMEYWSVKKGGE